MKSGNTLWQELCHRYDLGVAMAEAYRNYWNTSTRQYVDQERWQHVDSLLQVQLENAREWRKVCLDYFRQYSRQPITHY